MKPFRAFFALMALAGLAACSTSGAVPTQPARPIATPSGPLFQLDVAQVQIVAPPAASANEPVDMVGIVTNWCRDRLRAVGSSGTAKVTIHSALIREQTLRKVATGGTTFDRYRQFQGRFAVQVDVTDPSRQRFGFAKGDAARDRTAPADIGEDQRREIWYAMANDMLGDLNADLELNIQKRLRWLLR